MKISFMGSQMRNGLVEGFLSMAKQARLNDLLLHSVGKTKKLYLVGGEGAQPFLADKVLEQPLVRKLIDFARKIVPDRVSKIENVVRERLRSMDIGGTISSGKAYIDRDMAKSFAGGVRKVVHHEAFHLKPIVGKSETLAHIVGGLRSRKGAISPMGAVKDYGHLWRTRPARALIEHGVAGGGVYGGIKGVKALTGNDDTKSSE